MSQSRNAQATQYDVAVVGLGAMGLASLDACAARGMKVIGLEQFAPLHDFGSSHGRSRIIRRGYFEGDFYVPHLEKSYAMWHDLQKAAGRSFMTISGGVFAGPPTGEVVAGTLAAANAYGLEVELLESTDFNRRFPQFHLPDAHVAVYEPGAGYLDPDDVAVYLSARAASAGADMLHGTDTVRIEPQSGGGFNLTWQGHSIVAKKVIMAPGSWAQAALAPFGIRPAIQPERVSLHWFDDEGRRDLFSGANAPVGVWELTSDGQQSGDMFYGFPMVAGDAGLKFGFHTGHRQATTPDTIDRAVTRSEIAAVSRAFKDLIPGLSARHLRAKTCIYSSTPDSHFAFGPVEGFDGLYFAGGFSGHGYKFSLLIGDVMATLAADKQPEWDLTPFAPSRIFTQSKQK